MESLIKALADELTKAHEIIRIAVHVIRNGDRVAFIERINDAGLAGAHGATRANERNALLRRVRRGAL